LISKKLVHKALWTTKTLRLGPLKLMKPEAYQSLGDNFLKERLTP